MFVNLLIFLVVIGLAIFFGWLTYRALRAKRLWVKIAGGLGAGIMTLLLVVVASTVVRALRWHTSRRTRCARAKRGRDTGAGGAR